VKVVSLSHLGKDFVAEEFRIAVAYRVVKGASHGVFERARPLIGISFHEVEGRGAGGIGDIAGVDESVRPPNLLFSTMW
jgi:hypothetical protein